MTARDQAGEPLTQRIGAVLWPSFLAAAVGTTLLFALVDPAELAHAAWPRAEISRELGYALGFFGFWACTAGASTLTSLLGRVQPPARAADEDQDCD